MRHLALALALPLLDACAASAALGGTGETRTSACRIEEPCVGGGTGDTLAFGIGVAALAGLLGTGALVHQISRGALGSPPAATSGPGRSPSPSRPRRR